MISLDIYFSAKGGDSAELEKVIVDVWMEAMRQQPGFISRHHDDAPFPGGA